MRCIVVFLAMYYTIKPLKKKNLILVIIDRHKRIVE